MDERLRQTVTETIMEVFETMFFTFLQPLPDPASQPDWPPACPCIKAVLRFSGGGEGELAIYFPMTLAREITINFIGADPSRVEEKQILDTAREAANMVVGSLLGKIDPEGHCVLGIPTASVLTSLAAQEELLQEERICAYRTKAGLFIAFVGVGRFGE